MDEFTDDWPLLHDFAATGNPAAFDALVKRYANLVYGSARRRVGSADVADDVTQAAFIVLARKAGTIRREQPLSSWLFRVTRYAAVDALRRQSVRRRHERRAARPEAASGDAASPDAGGVLASHLDAVLDALPARDREAVLMRFFENRTLQQIGQAQRVAASTVQRRLDRSLARLGHDLKRRGVWPAGVSVTAVSTALAGLSAVVAPPSATAGLLPLATATGVLPATTSGPIGLAKGTMKTMTMLKLKLVAAAVAGVVMLGVGGVAITHVFGQSAAANIPSPATAPTTIRSGFVPPLVLGDGTPFLADGFINSADGKRLFVRLAVDKDRQLVAVCDFSTGTPLLLSDGRQTLVYEPSRGVRRIDDSFGEVRFNYDPAADRPLSVSFGLRFASASATQQQPQSWVRLENLSGVPSAEAGIERLTNDRPSNRDVIERPAGDGTKFEFRSISKFEQASVRLYVSSIGQPLGPGQLAFPDLRRLAGDVPVTVTSPAAMTADMLRLLQGGTFFMETLNLYPAQSGDGLDAARQAYTVSSAAYRRALERQGIVYVHASPNTPEPTTRP